MKNITLSLFILTLLCLACGPSEAEKQQQQEAQKEKIVADSITSAILIQTEQLNAQADSLKQALNELN